MKNLIQVLIVVFILLLSCSKSKIGVSPKSFPPISLVNYFEYQSGQHKYNQLGTAFLLKYQSDTFAITAKHILAFLKPDSLKTLTLENFISEWNMRPLNKENEIVVVDRLLNEDKGEELKSRKKFETDWLVFSIKSNTTSIVPLEFREIPLKEGEKLYAVGWTRHMKDGDQRVYEFEYYKQSGSHLLMRDVLVPGQKGGLSGGPVVDGRGKLVGIVSGRKFVTLAMENMFWPVGTLELRKFVESYVSNKDKLEASK